MMQFPLKFKFNVGVNFRNRIGISNKFIKYSNQQTYEVLSGAPSSRDFLFVQVIGVGAGQQSRIHCVRLAAEKANNWLDFCNLIAPIHHL